MLTYFSVIVFLLFGHMIGWTTTALERIFRGDSIVAYGRTSTGEGFTFCERTAPDYVRQAGESPFSFSLIPSVSFLSVCWASIGRNGVGDVFTTTWTAINLRWWARLGSFAIPSIQYDVYSSLCSFMDATTRRKCTRVAITAITTLPLYECSSVPEGSLSPAVSVMSKNLPHSYPAAFVANLKQLLFRRLSESDLWDFRVLVRCTHRLKG
jgi:hypothetical protein